jgi:hypothetical protein
MKGTDFATCTRLIDTLTEVHCGEDYYMFLVSEYTVSSVNFHQFVIDLKRCSVACHKNSSSLNDLSIAELSIDILHRKVPYHIIGFIRLTRFV